MSGRWAWDVGLVGGGAQGVLAAHCVLQTRWTQAPPTVHRYQRALAHQLVEEA